MQYNASFYGSKIVISQLIYFPYFRPKHILWVLDEAVLIGTHYLVSK